MCDVCGCGRSEGDGGPGAESRGGRDAEARAGHDHVHVHVHERERVHGGEQGPGREDEHEHAGADGVVRQHRHSQETGHARAATNLHGTSAERVLRVQEDLLARNDELAAANRARFTAAGSFAVNLMSSPGSGKTTLLTRTLTTLAGRIPAAVIVGDQQTSLDAERIHQSGAPAVQINTGRGCHLDAGMVARAADQLQLPRGLLFVENVGNLVCPAGFDLGEHARVVVVSVTEGEDKPLKYRDMFATADAVVVNKVDLLPSLAFDIDALEANLRRLRPDAHLFRVSSTTGSGLEAWIDWLERSAADASARHA